LTKHLIRGKVPSQTDWPLAFSVIDSV
jgi:hypothetical protein